jgi:hypothetical protein
MYMECPEELSFIVYEKNGTTISTYFIIKKTGFKTYPSYTKTEEHNSTISEICQMSWKI